MYSSEVPMNQTIDEDMDLACQDEIGRLEELVKRRLNGRLRSFELAVRDDGLILRGRTTTYYAKQLAQHAIMVATDIRIVANDIEVS